MNIFLSILMALAATSAVAAEGAAEGDPADVLEQEFEVGGSCAALAYLSSKELKTITSSAFADDFHSFCYPEEPFSCADYTSHLKGLGRMTTGEDGYNCSLQISL